MPTRYTELAKFVRAHAVLEGTFRLASGRTSSYYIDGKQVTHSAEGLRLMVEAMRAELAEFNIDAIGGRESGANSIAAAVALASAAWPRPVSAFFVRKEVKGHGTQKLIEGIIPPRGSRVAVVDDVVTTGGSMIQARKAVEAEGCKVVVASAVVDRLSGAAETFARRNVPYRPLLTIEDLGLSNDPPAQGELREAAR